MSQCLRDGCDNTFVPQRRGKPQKYCSKRCCGRVKRARFRASETGKASIKRYSAGYKAKVKSAAWRSSDKGKKYHEQYNAIYFSTGVGKAVKTRASHKRRSLQRGAFVEHVDIQVLIHQQFNLCSLCNGWIEGIHPNPLSPSIDHTIPLSKGGEHSYANCTAAHLRCNIAKGAKLAG